MDVENTVKLGMRNIRCFHAEEVKIRPLTLLIGDNSSGKSTTLACAQTVLETLALPIQSSWKAFNQNPHAMGKFKNIIRNSVSHSLDKQNGNDKIVLSHDSLKLGSKLEFSQDPKTFDAALDSINFDYQDEESGVAKTMNIKLYSGDEVRMEFDGTNRIDLQTPELYFYGADMKRFLKKILLPLADPSNQLQQVPNSSKESFRSIVNGILDELPDLRVVGSPAVRPPARRSYKFSEYYRKHTERSFPMGLFDFSEKRPEEWNKLKEEIAREGAQHDLFTDFYIKYHGGLSQKFEIMTIRDGIETNICDLGAGIWQVLQPLIALKLATILGEHRYFMLQQPDEHAHPRLQDYMASLYSFGIRDGHRFLIETHSDYILNRISTEISEGRLSFEDVCVAFYSHDADHNCCRISNSFFDSDGKLLNMPKYFLEFFKMNHRRYL